MQQFKNNNNSIVDFYRAASSAACFSSSLYVMRVNHIKICQGVHRGGVAGVSPPPGYCGRGQCPVGGHRVHCGRLQPDQRPGGGQGQVLEPPGRGGPVGPGDLSCQGWTLHDE